MSQLLISVMQFGRQNVWEEADSSAVSMTHRTGPMLSFLVWIFSLLDFQTLQILVAITSSECWNTSIKSDGVVLFHAHKLLKFFRSWLMLDRWLLFLHLFFSPHLNAEAVLPPGCSRSSHRSASLEPEGQIVIFLPARRLHRISSGSYEALTLQS